MATTQQPQSLALVRIDSLDDTLALRPTSNHATALDALLIALQKAPGRVKDHSHILRHGGSTYHLISISLILDGVEYSIDYNPRLPEKTLPNAFLFMKQGNYWYAEFLIKKSLGFKGNKTSYQAVNENNKPLLSSLLIAQYAQEKYIAAIDTALKLYEAGNNKLARRFVAQIAVKLDHKITDIEEKLREELYEGFVRLSEATKARLEEQKAYLLKQRVYAGRTLNYMKGTSYLREATRKSNPETKERAKALLT